MDEIPTPLVPSADPVTTPPGADRPATPPIRKKKKDKVRSAWISFLGRIVAQVVGAAASIALAVMFVQKSKTTDVPAPAAAVTSSQIAARAVTKRADGRLTLAVLPLSNYSADDPENYFADGMTEAL